MIEALEEAVHERGKPFLGICVGLQLMAERGLEHGVTPGLGWIKGEVRAIAPSDPASKIPHMGWNTLRVARAHPLLEGIPTGEGGLHAYFVHSYHLVPEETGDLVAEHRLRRPDHRLRRQGQYGRHAVPPREEPEARARADRQFPALEAMILFPAIDLKDGQCVRLRQGEWTQATVFNDDPAAQARSLRGAGLRSGCISSISTAPSPASRSMPRRSRRSSTVRSRCSSAAASATSPPSRPGSTRASPA